MNTIKYIPTAPSILTTQRFISSTNSLLSNTSKFISPGSSVLNSFPKSVSYSESIGTCLTQSRNIPTGPSIEDMLSSGMDFKTILTSLISNS